MAKLCYGCMKEKQHSPICEHCGYDERQRNESPCLPAGLILREQYLIGKVLGRGGFGITYLGWDMNLEQPVAIKEFFPSGLAGRETAYSLNVTDYEKGKSTSYEDFRSRFLKEAKILAKLRNIPQIVHVLNFFQENNTAYIVMEYIEGMDLRKYLKKLGRPMSAQETFRIMTPIMEALVQVHEAELVHRDISPDNIMLLPDGGVKLLDFGAARVVENADAHQQLTSSTQAIMKPGFAPPEQYQSRGALGPWTDVYAICATIYYCMTGIIPLESMARVTDDLQIDWDKLKGLSKKQISALQKGMSLTPKGRYPTVTALLTELNIQNGKSSTTPNKEKPPKNICQKSSKADSALISSRENSKDGASLSPYPSHRTDSTDRKKKNAYVKSALGILWVCSIVLFIYIMLDSGLFTRSPSEPGTKIGITETAPAVTVTEAEPKETIPEAGATIVVVETEPPLEATAIPTEEEYNEYETILPTKDESVPLPQLKITSKLELQQVDYGHREYIKISSDHNPDEIVWTSSNPNVVTVSNDGVITAVGFGYADVIANYQGQKATCYVTVDLKANVACTYVGNSDGLTITGFNVYNIPEHAVLPGIINGTPVTKIEDCAFAGCDRLINVYIPDQITEIGYRAFADCNNLKTVSLPGGLRNWDRTFQNCHSLEAVYFTNDGKTHHIWSGSQMFTDCPNIRRAMMPSYLNGIRNRFDLPSSCTITYY